MGCMRVLSICIYITHIMGKVKHSEDKVFAFAGCNATLEWILWNGTGIVTARVWNASGIKIAWMEDQYCQRLKDSSVHCYTRKRGEELLLSVVLINVTEANNGGYTGGIKYGLAGGKNITKELIVLDKPQIRKHDKIILSEPLNISCAVSGKLDGVKYRWKLNGADFNSTGLIDANLSILMFKRLWTVDKSSVFSCEVCEENSCCIQSETFALDPYYGPYTVDLDIKVKRIYLNENEKFTVKCSANCNPVCSFWWDGYIKSDNEELVISDFDSRKAGQYICNARNKKTDIKAKSDPIFLHLTEVASTVASSREQNKDSSLGLLGMGLVIVAVFLVIVGFLILKKMGCYSSIKLGSHISYRPCVEQVNNEACEELLSSKKRNRPLPMPPKQENACRRAQRSNYPNIHRKSKSLQKLVDYTKDVWNPVRKSLSLQTLIQLSQTIARRSNSHGSVDNVCVSKKDVWFSIQGTATRISLEKMHSKDRKDKKGSTDDQSTGAKPQGTTNSLHRSFELESQEDLYNSIDEAAMSVYDYSRANAHEANIQENRRNAGTGNYEYDYAILPGL